jgi:hypothetical protein
MRRPWLIALFVVLLALDARGVIELFRAHHHSALERLTGGNTLYWATWALVILFDLGVLWLTVRVGKRLRATASTAPRTESGGSHEQ